MDTAQLETREEKVAIALMYETAQVRKAAFPRTANKGQDVYFVKCPHCRRECEPSRLHRTDLLVTCWNCATDFVLDWSEV